MLKLITVMISGVLVGVVSTQLMTATVDLSQSDEYTSLKNEVKTLKLSLSRIQKPKKGGDAGLTNRMNRLEDDMKKLKNSGLQHTAATNGKVTLPSHVDQATLQALTDAVKENMKAEEEVKREERLAKRAEERKKWQAAIQDRVVESIQKELELDEGDSIQLVDYFSEYYKAYEKFRQDNPDVSRTERREAREKLRAERNEKVKTLLNDDEKYKKYETAINNFGSWGGRGGRRNR